MITLVTAPRRSLFGLCKDNTVHLSSEGSHVVEVWHKIPTFTPQIEAQELCVMPDHLHGILFAKEKLPRSLSAVVRGFKSGITSALRRLSQDPTLSVFQDGFHDLVSLQVKSIKAYSAYIRDNREEGFFPGSHPSRRRIDLVLHFAWREGDGFICNRTRGKRDCAEARGLSASLQTERRLF